MGAPIAPKLSRSGLLATSLPAWPTTTPPRKGSLNRAFKSTTLLLVAVEVAAAVVAAAARAAKAEVEVDVDVEVEVEVEVEEEVDVEVEETSLTKPQSASLNPAKKPTCETPKDCEECYLLYSRTLSIRPLGPLDSARRPSH